MKSSRFFIKNIFDFITASIALLLIGWFMIILWLIASIDTKSNGLFSQIRVGKNGRFFEMYKLKSMRGADGSNNYITLAGDPRISKYGRFLRKYKLDELPQLINVLNGTMSFVGPRPDVPGYADQLKGADRNILKLKPGITGPASLKYANEEELLSTLDHPLKYNDEVIYPDKVSINLDYYCNQSFIGDIKIILKTVFN